jgi:hypothetical protein
MKFEVSSKNTVQHAISYISRVRVWDGVLETTGLISFDLDDLAITRTPSQTT